MCTGGLAARSGPASTDLPAMSELGKAILLGIACFAVWLFAMVRAFWFEVGGGGQRRGVTGHNALLSTGGSTTGLSSTDRNGADAKVAPRRPPTRARISHGTWSRWDALPGWPRNRSPRTRGREPRHNLRPVAGFSVGCQKAPARLPFGAFEEATGNPALLRNQLILSDKC